MYSTINFKVWHMQTHRYDTELHTDLGDNLSYLELKNTFAAFFPFPFPNASPSQAIDVSALGFKTNLYLHHSRGEPSGNYKRSTLLKSTKLDLKNLTLTLFWVVFLGCVWVFLWFGWGFFWAGGERCLVLVCFLLLLFYLREREANSISTMLKQAVMSKAAMPGGDERPGPIGFTRVKTSRLR